MHYANCSADPEKGDQVIFLPLARLLTRYLLYCILNNIAEAGTAVPAAYGVYRNHG